MDANGLRKYENPKNRKNTLLFLERKNIFPSIPIKNKVLLVPILVDLEFDNIYFRNKDLVSLLGYDNFLKCRNKFDI